MFIADDLLHHVTSHVIIKHFPLNYYYPELFMKKKKAFTKKFNENVKIVGAAVGVFNITSYVAKTFFRYCIEKKRLNIASISESLGHTSLNTTQIYLDSFEKEEREKKANHLIVISINLIYCYICTFFVSTKNC